MSSLAQPRNNLVAMHGVVKMRCWSMLGLFELNAAPTAFTDSECPGPNAHGHVPTDKSHSLSAVSDEPEATMLALSGVPKRDDSLQVSVCSTDISSFRFPHPRRTPFVRPARQNLPARTPSHSQDRATANLCSGEINRPYPECCSPRYSWRYF